MPLLLLVPLAGLAFGGSFKLLGDGLEDITDSTVRLILIGGGAYVAYRYAVKKKVI